MGWLEKFDTDARSSLKSICMAVHLMQILVVLGWLNSVLVMMIFNFYSLVHACVYCLAQ